MKDKRDNTSMSAKGIKLLNPSESNWTNNYWALSKAFATMTHQIAHRVTHGLFCKMRNIRSPYLASCGIVLSERNERAKVYPWCTHCTTTKVHILHNNCLKMQSARCARKKRQKILLSREKILLKERTGENSLGWINFFITTNILPCTTMSFMNSFDSKTVLKASLK